MHKVKHQLRTFNILRKTLNINFFSKLLQQWKTFDNKTLLAVEELRNLETSPKLLIFYKVSHQKWKYFETERKRLTRDEE